MKIKFFKFKKNFKKENFQPNPNIFWEIILSLGFLMIICVSIFGFFLFKETNEEPILTVENANKQTKLINKERVTKILNYFSEREQKSKDIILSPLPPVIDPSL